MNPGEHGDHISPEEAAARGLVSAGLMAASDDVAILYRAACGDWHWRCYLCEPSLRSDHHETPRLALDDLDAHRDSHHPDVGFDLHAHRFPS